MPQNDPRPKKTDSTGDGRPTRQGTRRRAERRGRHAEWLAANFLRCKGYRIIERRFRCPAGEIDLIAQRNQLIAFVEVKQRRQLAIAAESIGSGQRHKIIAAARTWLAQRQIAYTAPHPSLRFDAILIAPWHWPQHIVGAFNADREVSLWG